MKHSKIEAESDEEYYNAQPDAHEDTCYEDCLSCCGVVTGCMKIWCPCVCCCCDSPLYQVLFFLNSSSKPPNLECYRPSAGLKESSSPAST